MGPKIKISVWAIVVAIVAMLALQYLWISKYYKQELSRIQTLSTSILDESLKIELHISEVERQKYVFENDLISKVNASSGVDYENMTVAVYSDYPEKIRIEKKCESDIELAKYSDLKFFRYHLSGVNFERLDSLYTALLKQNGIIIPHYLEKIDRTTGNVLETTKTDTIPEYSLATPLIELGIDDKDGMVARLDDSAFGVFRQMKNVIIVSLIILILLSTILAFLLRTIIYQKKLAEMREDYVNAMTHEIKNPIIYLKRVLGLIDSPEQTQRIKTANHKIEHLWLMLEKLLAVSRKHNLTIHSEDVNIHECLTDIVEQYKSENHGLDISIAIDMGKDTFHVDKLHFLNSVINLVDNAIKYSESDPVIRICCYESGNELCISVKDQGVGIPAEYHQRIFLKSFRVPENKSLKRYGFGLGLSYVKMVAEAHHGRVSLKSAPGEGSDFTIHLMQH